MSGNVKIKMRQTRAVPVLLAIAAIAWTGCASKELSIDTMDKNPPGPKPHRIKKATNVVIFAIPKADPTVVKFIPAQGPVGNYIVVTGPKTNGDPGTWQLPINDTTHLAELNDNLGDSEYDEAELQYALNTYGLVDLQTGEDYTVNFIVWIETTTGKELSAETREIPCHQ